MGALIGFRAKSACVVLKKSTMTHKGELSSELNQRRKAHVIHVADLAVETVSPVKTSQQKAVSTVLGKNIIIISRKEKIKKNLSYL